MKNSFKLLILIFIGALFLMTDAFYNGFPIVYSDTSTYIDSGLELHAPPDRPFTYGFFIRLFSLNGLSLWFVIFFQAFLLSTSIFLLTKLIVGKEKYQLIGLISIAFVSLFTGASWTVSQLMPDIFTPISLISIILILYGKYEREKQILLYLLFFMSIAMHMSHLILFSILLLILFAFRNYFLPQQEYPNRIKHFLIMFCLLVASITTMRTAMSKSKHVFGMGTLVEQGILKEYLNEYCPTKNYKLCEYKDSLPLTFNDFVWHSNSPLYRMGGWEKTKTEYNEIYFATLTQPKYIGLHIRESLKASTKQLVRFDIGDGNGRFLEGDGDLYQRICKYFQSDSKQYSSSKQNQQRLTFIGSWNKVFTVIMIISVIVLGFLSLKKVNKQQQIIAILFLITILISTWDCATFSMVADRFGCKVMWLIPLLMLIIGLNNSIIHTSKSDFMN